MTLSNDLGGMTGHSFSFDIASGFATLSMDGAPLFQGPVPLPSYLTSFMEQQGGTVPSITMTPLASGMTGTVTVSGPVHCAQKELDAPAPDAGTTDEGGTTDDGGGPAPVITSISIKNTSVTGRAAPGVEVLITGTNLVSPADVAAGLVGNGSVDPSLGLDFGTVSAGSVYANSLTEIETAVPVPRSYGSYPVVLYSSGLKSAPFPFTISCDMTGEPCGVDPGSVGGVGQQGCCNGCGTQVQICN
jgi:hypothetical protein